jgi:hypothetical protein
MYLKGLISHIEFSNWSCTGRDSSTEPWRPARWRWPFQGGIRSPLAALAMTHADWGKPEKARVIYEEMVARGALEYIQPSQMAIAAVAAGEREKAMDHAREAYEIRDPMLVTVLAGLRANARSCGFRGHHRENGIHSNFAALISDNARVNGKQIAKRE